MSTKETFTRCLFLVFLVQLGCSEKAGETHPSPVVRERRVSGGKPLSVDKIRLSDTEAKVKLYLGEPGEVHAEERAGLERGLFYYDKDKRIRQFITLGPRDDEYVVRCIQGEDLYQGDTLLVARGDPPESVLASLGEPTSGKEDSPPRCYLYQSDNLRVFFHGKEQAQVDSVEILDR